MWMIFNQDGSFSRSISIEPHPNDIQGMIVMDVGDGVFDFATKQYSLVDGEIVAGDYTPEPPPPIDPPTVQEKLAAAGIDINELKAALGL